MRLRVVADPPVCVDGSLEARRCAFASRRDRGGMRQVNVCSCGLLTLSDTSEVLAAESEQEPGVSGGRGGVHWGWSAEGGAAGRGEEREEALPLEVTPLTHRAAPR